MNKIDLNKIKQIDWAGFTRKNRYSLVSVLILAGYFYVVFTAISFIVSDARRAFSFDSTSSEKPISSFNIANYEKVKRRIGE